MKLSDKLSTLIIMGVKQTGSYDPKETMTVFEEQLTGVEHLMVEAFLNWCHKKKKVFGSATIHGRWKEFLATKKPEWKQVRKPKNKKPVFLVTVTRTAHATREFRVTGAKNDVHALQVAQDKAGNFTFSEKASEYTVDGVIEIEANESTTVEEIKA